MWPRRAEPDGVVDAVRRVATGELVFPPSVANVVLDQLRTTDRPRTRARHPALAEMAPREIDVLPLMAEDHSNQAIAERMFLGIKTVEAHVRSIFSKLGLEQDSDVHPRVLAVITYLRST